METTRHMIPVRDVELAADFVIPTSGNTNKIAVLLHGGPGGVKEGPTDLYVNLAALLAADDIASIRFDFAGVGESSGRYRDMTISTQVEEFVAVTNYVKRTAAPESLMVIGESYGGTIAILGLARVEYQCLVLLWPAIYLLDQTFGPFVTAEKLQNAQDLGFNLEEGAEVGLPFLQEVLSTQDVSAGLENCTVPTLFMHGDADQEVPYQQSFRGAELLAGPKRAVIVPDGDHCLEKPSEREMVHHEVRDWVRRYF